MERDGVYFSCALIWMLHLGAGICVKRKSCRVEEADDPIDLCRKNLLHRLSVPPSIYSDLECSWSDEFAIYLVSLIVFCLLFFQFVEAPLLASRPKYERGEEVQAFA